MKILILSINYWPEVTGIGAFTTYRAEHLAAAGHKVEVCTTFPYYPSWKIPREYSGKLGLTENRNGVRIVRSRAYVPNPVTPIKRVLHEGSFVAGIILRGLLRKRPDVMLVVSPPLGLTAPAILLSRLWGVPYVYDVEDLQPDSAGDLNMLPRWAIRFLYNVERAAYRHARLITTLTPSMRQRLIAKGLAEEKVELLEPRMDDSLTNLLPEEGGAFRRRYDLGDKFLVTHSGNMGVKQGLDVILEAALLSRADDSMLFLCVGDGVECDRIKRRAAELDLCNLRFLPVLDEKDFRGLMAASGICLVTQQHSVSEVAFPSKIVTYLAAGRPVVASVNPGCEVANVIRESGAGKIVAAGDARGLFHAVNALRRDGLPQAGENAREYASARWSSARVLGELERCLAAAAEPDVRSLVSEGFKP
jgi:colanic acid biosynthesis glycosyl transferase WcaI